MSEHYQVKLDAFEGPLDLLLHLINRLEIDIYDIPVAQITDQYMHYIHTMQQIELNVASEYLVMAATLLEIKSSMLLPKNDPVEFEDEYEEDPREKLIQRLIEYKKFKEAADKLKEKELEENQLYVRPKIEIASEPLNEITEQAAQARDLLDALDSILARQELYAPIETTVAKSEITIEERMHELLEKLPASKTAFHTLFPYQNKQHIVITFLAVLHLLKTNQIHCSQKDQFGVIYVAKVGDEHVN